MTKIKKDKGRNNDLQKKNPKKNPRYWGRYP
jgi:hypothetical protein